MQKVTLLNVVGSLFAGWFGVQSDANRERDFTYGTASTYIYGGIIFVILFVLAVWGIVQIVLSLAGVE